MQRENSEFNASGDITGYPRKLLEGSRLAFAKLARHRHNILKERLMPNLGTAAGTWLRGVPSPQSHTDAQSRVAYLTPIRHFAATTSRS